MATPDTISYSRYSKSSPDEGRADDGAEEHDGDTHKIINRYRHTPFMGNEFLDT